MFSAIETLKFFNSVNVQLSIGDEREAMFEKSKIKFDSNLSSVCVGGFTTNGINKIRFEMSLLIWMFCNFLICFILENLCIGPRGLV